MSTAAMQGLDTECFRELLWHPQRRINSVAWRYLGDDATRPSETRCERLAEWPSIHRECRVLFNVEDHDGADTACALGFTEA